jgi:hypothetical protein
VLRRKNLQINTERNPTSGGRFEMAPELPAIAEIVPRFEVTSWYGLYVPRKTPGSIVQKMNADVLAILRDSGMKAKFEPLGVAVRRSTARWDCRGRSRLGSWNWSSRRSPSVSNAASR